MHFVVIASQRTGSTHLVNLLSGHPDIFCNANIFKKGKVQLFWPQSDLGPQVKAELLTQRRRDPIAFMERVFAANYGREHVGFKLFPGQCPEALDRIIADPEIRKVILYRRNVLANYASLLAAQQTHQYSVAKGREPLPAPKVEFGAAEFVNFHNRYNGFYADVIARLNAARQIFHKIHYDEINDRCSLGALISYIGGDPAKSLVLANQHAELERQNISDILARFSKPERVENFLRRHGLLHWSHEGETALTARLERQPLVDKNRTAE